MRNNRTRTHNSAFIYSDSLQNLDSCSDRCAGCNMHSPGNICSRINRNIIIYSGLVSDRAALAHNKTYSECSPPFSNKCLINWNILQNYCPGADYTVHSNFHPLNHCCVCPDKDAIRYIAIAAHGRTD